MGARASATPDLNTDKPPSGRRWIPLSLRMFVATVVFLAIFSVLWVAVPAYRQSAAIREIERLGGYIQSRPRGPKVLRAWVGDERMRPFDEVYIVLLDGSDATDATLARIGCLDELRSLSLSDTQIGDAGLAYLEPLRRLEFLSVDGTRITDAGLVHLRRLTTLQSLGLSQTHVTDKGLQHLKDLRNLESLWVQNTFVSYAGVVDLCQALPGLMQISR